MLLQTNKHDHGTCSPKCSLLSCPGRAEANTDLIIRLIGRVCTQLHFELSQMKNKQKCTTGQGLNLTDQELREIEIEDLPN